MKKIIGYTVLSLYVAFMIVFIGILRANSNKEIKKKDNVEIILKSALEKAYASGQKDALDGDIRIKSIDFGRYVWIKSPWDSGNKAITDTLKLDSKGNF